MKNNDSYKSVTVYKIISQERRGDNWK